VPPEFAEDFDEATVAGFRAVQPFTMTSIERYSALCRSVDYIARNRVAGDIVECGVWKGGSMMAIARTLLAHDTTRQLYLFDTFEGMSEPTEMDVLSRDRKATAADLMEAEKQNQSNSLVWAYSPLDEVKRNMRSTGYDESRITYVKGKVDDTLPGNAPASISLLRLDTDWYESTYHELVHLYPRLSPGGVLIIDDYGHWEGARRAVDQYFQEKNLPVLLNRIDYTGRICIKPSS
jgi:hypothetical protein